MPSFREKNTVLSGERYRRSGGRIPSLRNTGARPYQLGRPPVYLRPPALICWSGRPKPIFILSLGVLLGEVEPAAALEDFSQTWMDAFAKAVKKVGVKALLLTTSSVTSSKSQGSNYRFSNWC